MLINKEFDNKLYDFAKLIKINDAKYNDYDCIKKTINGNVYFLNKNIKLNDYEIENKFFPFVNTRIENKKIKYWSRNYYSKFYKFIDDIYTFTILILTECFFDRTGVLSSPKCFDVEFKLNSKIPHKWSFLDTCLYRLSQLEDKAKNHEEVSIFYSGGIDSTCVVSLLFNYASSDLINKVKIYLTHESINENEYFFYEYIRRFFNYEICYDLISEFKFDNNLLVTGEGCDQLFGSMLPNRLSFDSLETFYDKLNDIYFEICPDILKQKDKTFKERFIKYINKSEKKFDIKINSIKDVGKLMNFGLKLQNINYRLRSYISTYYSLPKNHDDLIFNFFISEKFDQWVLNNFNEDLDKDVIKKIIYTINKDIDYYKNKQKVFSLSYLNSCYGLILSDGTPINNCFNKNRYLVNPAFYELENLLK